MIRALLDGRKSQTRRIVKPQPELPGWWPTKKDRSFHWASEKHFRRGGMYHCPRGHIGDLLWVRETFYIIGEHPGPWPGSRWTHYRADLSNNLGPDEMQWKGPWKPSIYMPRKASRLTLRITNIRVERVQDITEEDAITEGFKAHSKDIGGMMLPVYPLAWFDSLWNSIHGTDAWDRNPFVWVIEFEVIKQNVDELIAGASNYAGYSI